MWATKLFELIASRHEYISLTTNCSVSPINNELMALQLP
ncbi:hypothetical protein Cflav_PD4514 [Pedosphaera parvula Ellin514]|uniref:Uncharacterized protein n=1 Tax=Pedosphaera parvula (strain Ellin514) TaxID=320771 RepID=B9XDW0_PEDPL|nr:hypothetical protein Cflav_PD4514 [Pedosphaera parvula Ellin514]